MSLFAMILSLNSMHSSFRMKVLTTLSFIPKFANSEEQLAILFVLKQVVSIIAYMYGIK